MLPSTYPKKLRTIYPQHLHAGIQVSCDARPITQLRRPVTNMGYAWTSVSLLTINCKHPQNSCSSTDGEPSALMTCQEIQCTEKALFFELSIDANLEVQQLDLGYFSSDSV